MNVHLETQLTEAMREYADGVRLSGEVLHAAARRHRRRTITYRSAYAAPIVGLIGVLAVGLPANGPPPAGPQGVDRNPAMLTVAQVSTQVNAALGESAGLIEHVVVSATLKGHTLHMEGWLDATTRSDHRRASVDIPGKPAHETWATHDGTRLTVTTVDSTRRVWWTDTRSVPVEKQLDSLSPSTPEEIQRALTEGSNRLVLVGREDIDGRATLHLRMSTGSTAGSDDLWVDATTYRVVRRVILKPNPPDGHARIQEDFDWLERTPENLARVTFNPPAGYTQVPAPTPDEPTPTRS